MSSETKLLNLQSIETVIVNFHHIHQLFKRSAYQNIVKRFGKSLGRSFFPIGYKLLLRLNHLLVPLVLEVLEVQVFPADQEALCNEQVKALDIQNSWWLHERNGFIAQYETQVDTFLAVKFYFSETLDYGVK